MELDGEIIPPGAFLPHAEKTELIRRVDRWAVERGIEFAPAGRVAINLSAKSLDDPELSERIEEALADRALAENVIFEITETAAASDLDRGTDAGHEADRARLRRRPRRFRHRLRIVHLSQAAAGHRAEDRHRVHPRPGRRSGRPACGRVDDLGGQELRHQDGRRGSRGRGHARASTRARGRHGSGLPPRPPGARIPAGGGASRTGRALASALRPPRSARSKRVAGS